MNNDAMITELQRLHTEMLESQKVKNNLLQHKIIAVASLAAIALGFTNYKNETKIDADYVLCIIPFVCAYFDLRCYNETMRILVIACFLKHNDDPYEGYISELDAHYDKGIRYFFSMVDFAFFGMSFLFSFFLAIYASLLIFQKYDSIKGAAFLCSSIIAMIICYLVKYSFENGVVGLLSTAHKLKERLIINNKVIKKIIKNSYSKPEIRQLFSFLYQKDTFLFSSLKNGLFPAANLQIEFEYTGYNNVWVRDNIHIAHAHYINDYTEIAVKNVTAFADYFIKYQWRFEKILSGELDFNGSS